MNLSILITSIPERMEQAKGLIEKLQSQIHSNDVEILCYTDNRIRSIGEKRNDLLNNCKGKYFSFIDDDDTVSDDYISEITEAIKENPDLITFNQKCSLDGKEFIVSFGLENENEQAQLVDDKFSDIKRKPFHICVWKKELVKDIKFPEINYGEDWNWAERAIKEVKKEKHIDKILHYYNFSTELTRAQ